VGNRYVWQGGQTENQGGQTKKKISALRAEFYQTNVCPPWAETLPAPLLERDCGKRLSGKKDEQERTRKMPWILIDGGSI